MDTNTPSSATLLSVEGLRVELPSPWGLQTVVQDVNLSVASGETVGLVGRSGSGKSLTAMAVLGLLPRKARVSGRILFAGQDLLPLRESGLRRIRGRRIAAIFQEPHAALNPVRAVGRQIGEVLRVRAGLSRRDARLRRVELLRAVGIEEAEIRQFSFPHQLSGGQAQRVMIAMALAARPELLIADEPTTALDADTGRQVMDLLIRLQREHAFGLILISHDRELIAANAGRVVIMGHGQEDGAATAAPVQSELGDLRSAAPESAGSVSLLDVKDLSVRFASPGGGAPLAAIDGVSLRLAENEVVALVGQSGCGKTTLARSILGLTEPAAGEIHFLGERLSRGRRSIDGVRRAPIQMVFQDPYTTLNPRRTVAQALQEAAACGGRDRRAPSVAELLAKVELPQRLAYRYPHELSGGERQRVAIARALAVRPRLLILDEPVSSLDMPVRIKLLTLLERLRRSEGLTLLLISHDMELVEAWAHRVAVMRRGRIVEQVRGESPRGAGQSVVAK